MAKRLFDIGFAATALILSAPLWVLAIAGIALSSPGPIFYHAHRVGRGGALFRMHKFRTMDVSTDSQSEITAPGDRRIFPLGGVLRSFKIDELPQLLNIIRGDMSIVGPRPESAAIVSAHYSDWMHETLDAAPGLTSVGALFNYSYGDDLLDREKPEESYVERMLPVKLALERAYLERASFAGDLAYMALTVAAIALAPIGLRIAPVCRDLQRATRWVDPQLFPGELRGKLASRDLPAD